MYSFDFSSSKENLGMDRKKLLLCIVSPNNSSKLFFEMHVLKQDTLVKTVCECEREGERN